MMNEIVAFQLIIVRHGESYGNIGADCNFPKDDPGLTPIGFLQAKLTGDRLAMGKIDAFFSSPLTRALQTAQMIVDQRTDSLKIHCLADLMETDTTPGFTGCDKEKIDKSFPDVLLESLPTKTGGGLSLQQEDNTDKFNRAVRVIDYLKNTYSNGETVVLVTHATFTKFLLRAALGLSADEIFRFSEDNCSLTKVKFYKNHLNKLSYSNDISHLYSFYPQKTFTI